MLQQTDARPLFRDRCFRECCCWEWMPSEYGMEQVYEEEGHLASGRFFSLASGLIECPLLGVRQYQPRSIAELLCSPCSLPQSHHLELC